VAAKAAAPLGGSVDGEGGEGEAEGRQQVRTGDVSCDVGGIKVAYRVTGYSANGEPDFEVMECDQGTSPGQDTKSDRDAELERKAANLRDMMEKEASSSSAAVAGSTAIAAPWLAHTRRFLSTICWRHAPICCRALPLDMPLTLQTVPTTSAGSRASSMAMAT